MCVLHLSASGHSVMRPWPFSFVCCDVPQVRLTGRLQMLLPSFLPGILGLGSSTAVERLVVDDERHTLYMLAQPSTIQVWCQGV